MVKSPGAKSPGAKSPGAKPTDAKSPGKAAPRKRPKVEGEGRDPAARLRRALLDLVAKDGWRDLSYAKIAEEAGLGLAEALQAYPSKGAILSGLARAIDSSVLSTLAGDPLDGSARDRLFDLLMRRFDRLKADRAAYAMLAQELPWTPAEALCLACTLRRSLALMLEAAGISASGLMGAAKIEALGGAYALALRVFFGDESADLAATMAELDKRLAQLEKFYCLARCKRRK